MIEAGCPLIWKPFHPNPHYTTRGEGVIPFAPLEPPWGVLVWVWWRDTAPSIIVNRIRWTSVRCECLVTRDHANVSGLALHLLYNIIATNVWIVVTRSNVSDPALHLLVNQCTMWNHMQSFALFVRVPTWSRLACVCIVYRFDRWHDYCCCEPHELLMYWQRDRCTNAINCITIGCIYLCIYAYIHALSDEEEEEEEEGLLFAKWVSALGQDCSAER